MDETYDTRRAQMGSPFSLTSGFLGWSVATFFAVIFVTVALGAIGSTAYQTNAPSIAQIAQPTVENLTTGAILACLVGVFLAFFLGGFAVGKMDPAHAAWQGVVVVGWAVIFGMAAGLMANAVNTYHLSLFLEPYAVNWNLLTGRSALVVLATLVVALAGSVFGATRAVRWTRTEAVAERHRRFDAAVRGRPRA